MILTNPNNSSRKVNRKLKIKNIYKAIGNWNSRNYKIIPQITLQGNWLQEAGFQHGDQVSIHVEDGQLTIRPFNYGK